jgi:hypothetical protein
MSGVVNPQELITDEKVKMIKKARSTVVSVFVFTAILFLFTLITSSMLIETGNFYGNKLHIGFGSITLVFSLIFLIPMFALIVGFNGFNGATEAITSALILEFQNKLTLSSLSTIIAPRDTRASSYNYQPPASSYNYQPPASSYNYQPPTSSYNYQPPTGSYNYTQPPTRNDIFTF